MRSRPRILCQRPKSRTPLDSCRSPAAGYFVCCNHVAEHVSHVVTSYTVRPLPFLFGLHPAFLRRRGQDSSPAPAREVPLLTRRAPTSHGVAPRVCKGNKSSGQRPRASTPPGKQICKPRRRTDSPVLMRAGTVRIQGVPICCVRRSRDAARAQTFSRPPAS